MSKNSGEARRETHRTATGSAYALLWRDKTVALPANKMFEIGLTHLRRNGCGGQAHLIV